MPGTQWLAVLTPCIFVSGLGVLMMRSHIKGWREQKDSFTDELEEKHLQRRFRRRMQASALLVLLGLLIGLGQLIDGPEHPLLFTFYWLGVLLLTCWIILLALGDAVSIAAYSRVAQAQLDQQRRSIEAELERLKARQSNGHARTDRSSLSDDSTP